MARPCDELQQTIDTLRGPGGCPWDRKQDLVSASRYLMDEAGELLDAALEGDPAHAREELGDLLFMVSFCCRILAEEQPLTMDDVAREGNQKLIRRHPHVFGGTSATTTEESQERWNEIKADEKRAKGLDPDAASALKDMPASTAPLHQAHDYQKDAARVGFDWPDLDGVWAKIREEEGELHEAVTENDPAAVEHEMGDLLFALVNLSRRLGVQPDLALRKANTRFRARFHLVEEEFRGTGTPLAEAELDAMEAAWQRAKKRLAG
ncbi:MAG: nucleoside triphosphate pyrophosphohydrolase [bacterium]|nr:nucleoside triphosphate pyrophosphohydrolase [bacterium]